MNEGHILTDNELKKIKEAASTVRKFAKYIEQVNLSNTWLKKNLEEAIKAGDVTNKQKSDLFAIESAEKEYSKTIALLQEKCRSQYPECNCEQEKHDTCEIYHEFIVAMWMRGAFRGSDFDWKNIFECACIGRKQWVKDHILKNQKVSW